MALQTMQWTLATSTKVHSHKHASFYLIAKSLLPKNGFKIFMPIDVSQFLYQNLTGIHEDLHEKVYGSLVGKASVK